MRSLFLTAGIRLTIGVLLLGMAYFVVNYSNFYYLFIGNMLLLSGLAIFTEGLIYLLLTLVKKLQRRKTAFISISRSTFIVIFIADVVIRFIGVMQTYPEKADGKYFSIAQQEMLATWYWAHTPNSRITNRKKEFLYDRNVNSLGISEKEISIEKGSKFRILAIGDSFTEGVGTSYEDSWVKQMETRWKSKNVESINGGIGGSDPVYAFALYRDKLVNYHPDIVILTINSTDITDLIGRGGFERFHSDGTAGKEAPPWEWAYACNHLFRMVIHGAFGYNSSLIQNVDSKEEKLKAVEGLKEVIKRLNATCSANNSKLLVILQPTLSDFDFGKHTPFFGQVELGDYMRKRQINYLDASIPFAENWSSISEYYYPLDTHFNKKGYALFGKTVYEKIEELGLLE